MHPSQNGERSNHSEAHQRLLSIHGAASAAVVAVNRLSSILPLANHSHTEELEAASERLAGSLRRLDEAVTRVMQINVENAGKLLVRTEQHESNEKWQKRYHAVERERDSLQEMLVALKERYEKLQNAYSERQHAYDLKVLEHESLQLRHLEARQRLDQSLALLDTLIGPTEDTYEAG
jgi:chromosome segregation ATPase